MENGKTTSSLCHAAAYEKRYFYFVTRGLTKREKHNMIILVVWANRIMCNLKTRNQCDKMDIRNEKGA